MKRIASLLISALIALPAAAQFDFSRALEYGKKAIDSGKKLSDANREFSTEEEVALGEGIAAGLLGAAPPRNDAAVQRYVNRVGKWVALHSERADLPWTFAVIEGDSINAFAMPGGTVVISRGLMQRLGSEAELAAVLAHEIAHVVRKHQLAAIQSSLSAGVWSSIGREAADQAISRRGGNALTQQGKSFLADKGIEVLQNGVFLRPLDRGMEYEADRMAVVLAARAGYDPYGLVAVLQTLQQFKGDGSGIDLLETHPAPADRLNELERSMGRLDRYASQPQNEARFRQVAGKP
jgi:predicted Zn-dependent protease